MSENATQDDVRDQLPKNLFSNIANFIVSAIIGILLIPYFIGTIGITAYGLISRARTYR